MLAHPAFCDMVHSIGVASLCADEKQIWHLTKIYWYTVEFGVVQEDNEMKAFGAGEHIRTTDDYHWTYITRVCLYPFCLEERGNQ